VLPVAANPIEGSLSRHLGSSDGAPSRIRPRLLLPRGPGGRPEPIRGGFLRGGARPPTGQMITYVDDHKDRYGVEPICALLPIAPSTYYDARRRPPSARALGSMTSPRTHRSSTCCSTGTAQARSCKRTAAGSGVGVPEAREFGEDLNTDLSARETRGRRAHRPRHHGARCVSRRVWRPSQSLLGRREHDEA
jgi:hypothetical protein